MPTGVLLACLLALWHNATAYRTDIDEAGEAAFCEHRKHLTFKPSATCCANQVVKTGLNVEQHWRACVEAKGGQSETVEGIGWDIYACILGKVRTGNGRMSLKEFADLISGGYPDDIKAKISAKVEEEAKNIPPATITNYGRLEKIRVAYYDIEKEVCEGMASESKVYGKIEMCSDWMEENHRNGMCCKTSYPVDIRFDSVFDLNSEKIKENCRPLMHELLVANKMNATDMMENSLLEMCDVACYMNVIKYVVERREYHNLKLEEILNGYRLLPGFLHPTMKDGIKEFLELNTTFNLNATIEQMKSFTFADVIPFQSHTERPMHNLAWVRRGSNQTGENFKYEFMGRPFHWGILHIPVHCTVLKQFVTQAERFLYQNCQPEDVTEAPAEAEAEPPAPETQTEAPPPPAEDAGAADATTDAA